jgi:hypothetical protein
MTSREKVLAAMEHLETAEDDELGEAIPGIPSGIIRAALPFVIDSLPTRSTELDEFLTGVGDFCHSMRSDPS